MCGRYSLAMDGETLEKEFGVKSPVLKKWVSRYNIAPSHSVPVLFTDSGERNAGIRPGLFRWGLIPEWATDETVGSRMINARSETVSEKPAFKNRFLKQRCLVPADGFYEWNQKAVPKTPYFFRLRSGKPFAFAGLWGRWVNPQGNSVYSFTILTSNANEKVRDIHDRMPVILARNRYEEWLHYELGSVPDGTVFEPYPASEMTAYSVSSAVNSPFYDSPQCVVPIDEGLPKEYQKNPEMFPSRR